MLTNAIKTLKMVHIQKEKKNFKRQKKIKGTGNSFYSILVRTLVMCLLPGTKL